MCCFLNQNLGQVLHIISLHVEYPHPFSLSAELVAVSLGTVWLHNSHRNKRCSELLGAGSVRGWVYAQGAAGRLWDSETMPLVHFPAQTSK